MSNQEKDGVNNAAEEEATAAMTAETTAPLVQDTDIVDDACAAGTTALDEAEKFIEDSFGVAINQVACPSTNLEFKADAVAASEEHFEGTEPSHTKEVAGENEALETVINEEMTRIQSKEEDEEEQGINYDTKSVERDKEKLAASGETQKENETLAVSSSYEQAEAAQTAPPPGKAQTIVDEEAEVEILTGESETDFQSPVKPQAVQQQDGNIQGAIKLAEDDGDECESGDMDEDASCSLHGGGAGSALESVPSTVVETVVHNKEENEEGKVEATTATASMEDGAAMVPMTAETTPQEISDANLPVTQEDRRHEPNDEVITEAKVTKSAEEHDREKENEKNNDNENNEASIALSSPDTPPPFVNEGLLRWEKARMSWLSHQHQRGGGGSGDEDDSSFSCKPAAPAIPLDVDEIIDVIFASPRPGRLSEGGPRKFPQPVPLPQLVDLLQDLWEAEGIDP